MHFLGTGPKFQNVPKVSIQRLLVGWLVKIVHFFTEVLIGSLMNCLMLDIELEYST